MDDRTRELLQLIRNFALNERPTGRSTWLKQEGELRLGPDQPWVPFEAEEKLEDGSLGFDWKASLHPSRFVTMTLVDRFHEGRGQLQVRVLGEVPISEWVGASIDRGEAIRALAELPWKPLGFGAVRRVDWASTSERTLRATYRDGRIRASVEFETDPEGRIVRVFAPDRPRTIGKTTIDTPWSGVYGDYRLLDGVRVPTWAEGTWHLPDGPFTWWRGRLSEFHVLP
jgi:hypothetical protein